MDQRKKVSIIIPVKNSANVLTTCLQYIQSQTYNNIEIIIVDSNSSDNTKDICKNFSARYLQLEKKNSINRFDATDKRNLGARMATGDFVYYLDADFELTPNVISEAVETCDTKNVDAIIVKEIVRGSGFWTKCRHLEQECYWGDDNVEAPRFFKKSVWDTLNGLDSNLGAGCDDWDLYQRFLERGYLVARIQSPLYHNEGKITLIHTIHKALLYGKDVSKFVKKNPRGGFLYFFPIRPAYIRNWRLFLRQPHLGIGLVFLRSVEYLAGAIGIFRNFISKQ